MRTGRPPRVAIAALPAALLLAVSGCEEPPSMVRMAPPGQQVEVVYIDPNIDENKPNALGEDRVQRARVQSRTGRALPPMPTLRGPTKEGQEVLISGLGLTYSTLREGDPTGGVARQGDTIVVRYTGTLDDGTVFDSTKGRGPATFDLDPEGDLIKGWIEGIPGMREGEVRKLIIPPGLGYGSRGLPPDIPPDARLTFEIELVDVIQR